MQKNELFIRGDRVFQTKKVHIQMMCLIAFLLFAGSARAQILNDLYVINGSVSDSHIEYHSLVIPAGGEVELANLKGPGKITYFYITDNSGGVFYPGLVLKVFWDDRKEADINVPLSDFFGAIGSVTVDYQSLPMQINHYCYMCYLPMPFSTRARFVLANDGNKEYRKAVAYGIDYQKNAKFAGEKSRLKCKWFRSNPIAEGMHTILEVSGAGKYIGNFLQVFSRYKGWWGEGDTIFIVDGKKYTHTPGTEDEYGSCWSFEHTFSYMYSGYIQNEKGNNRMYRWYIANPVCFQTSLKVEIQNQRWNKGQTASRDDYTSVAFWYEENGTQTVSLQPYDERVAESNAIYYDGK